MRIKRIFGWLFVLTFSMNSVYSQKIPHVKMDSVMHVYLPYNKINIVGELPELDSIIEHRWKIIEGFANLEQVDSLARIDGLVEGRAVARYIATDTYGKLDSTDVIIKAKYMEESLYKNSDPARAIIITTSTGRTLATADGKRLRGSALPVYSVKDAAKPLENKFFNQNYYKKLHNMGFNALRTFTEWTNLHDSTELYNSLAILDTIVNMCSKYKLQLVIEGNNIGYYHYPADEIPERVEYLKHWWSVLSNRYKNRTHVIFEHQNEPFYDSPNTYPTIVQDVADGYQLIRSVAPASQVLLFSFMIPCSFSMINLTKELEDLVSIDWTKTSVAYHGYGDCSNPNKIVELMAEYPVVNTEFWGDKNLGGFNDGTYQAEAMEINEISWFTWFGKEDSLMGKGIIDFYPHIFNHLENNGLMWEYNSISYNEPVVHLGNDTTIFEPNDSILLIGEAKDNDSIIRYEWQLTGKTGNVDFSYNEDTAILVNMTPGIFYLKMYAWDNDGNYIYDNIQVVVSRRHEIPGKIKASDIAAMYHVATEPCFDDDGGLSIGYIQLDGWLDYAVNVEETGLYGVEYRVAADDGFGGVAKLTMGDSTVGNTFKTGETGGWQSWKTRKNTAYLPEGMHQLRFSIVNTGFNLNWMNFVKLYASWSAGDDKSITLPVDSVYFTANASDSTGISAYSWRQIGGPSLSSGMKDRESQTLWIKNITKDGEYLLEMTAYNGLNFPLRDTVKLLVYPCTENCETSFEEKSYAGDIKLYPNPTNKAFFIYFPGISYQEKMHVTVFDTHGRILQHENAFDPLTKIDVSSLNEGIYFVHVKIGIQSFFKKLLIQKH